MSWLSGILQRTSRLAKFSYLVILVPFMFSFNPELIYPIYLANILILVYLLYDNVFEFFNWWRNSLLIFKFITGMIGVGSILSIWFLWQLSQLSISPLVIALLVFINHYIWQGRKIVQITDFPYIPVFRSEVNSDGMDIKWQKITDSMVITIVIVILFIIFESFIRTNGQEIFIIDTLWWGLTVVYVGSLKIADLFIEDQIYWNLRRGSTTWKTEDNVPYLPDFNNHQEFGNYMQAISKMPIPPENFISWLDSHLIQILPRFEKTQYTRVFHLFIRAFSYWGELSSHYVHYLHLIVLSTLKRYRTMGLVPIYNRYVFFQYLELLYKYQYLPKQWRVLITHEILNNEYAWHLGWILGKELEKSKELVWISYWNGKIFKGRAGYDRLHQYIQPLPIPQTSNWEEDIWKLTFDCLQMFVGEEKQKSRVENQSKFDAIDFLARKQTLEEYYEERQNYQQSLAQPADRFVKVERQVENREENRKRMVAYLRGEDIQSENEGMLFEVILLGRSIRRTIYNLDLGLIGKFLFLVVCVVLNLLLFDLVLQYISETMAQIALVLEILLLQFLTITEGQNDMLNINQAGEQANEKLLIGGFTQETEYPRLQQMQTVSLIYFFLLSFGYILVF